MGSRGKEKRFFGNGMILSKIRIDPDLDLSIVVDSDHFTGDLKRSQLVITVFIASESFSECIYRLLEGKLGQFVESQRNALG